MISILTLTLKIQNKKQIYVIKKPTIPEQKDKKQIEQKFIKVTKISTFLHFFNKIYNILLSTSLLTLIFLMNFIRGWQIVSHKKSQERVNLKRTTKQHPQPEKVKNLS